MTQIPITKRDIQLLKHDILQLKIDLQVVKEKSMKYEK